VVYLGKYGWELLEKILMVFPSVGYEQVVPARPVPEMRMWWQRLIAASPTNRPPPGNVI